MRRLIPIAFILIVPFITLSQKKSVEKRIIQSVDQNQDEARDLLLNAININSGTMNFAGVKEVGALFQKEFDRLGFTTNWEDGQPFDRAGHLTASRNGRADAVKVMLIGHLDTVFEPDHPFQSYTVEGDSILRGPGAVDMKGGDVIIIYALQALKDAGVLDEMNIRVVMTGDEEKSGSPLNLSKKALIDAGDWADVAIGFENGDSNHRTAVVSRRGSIGWELSVTGNAAHSSQIFSEQVGAGAIFEASRILHEFYRELAKEPMLTFNPGAFLGGTAVSFDPARDGGNAFGKKNVVAQEVVVSGDIRAVSPEQLQMAKNIMQRIVSENLDGTSAELKFHEGYPPLPPADMNYKLLDIYSSVSIDLGLGEVTAVDPIRAGAADVSFTSGRVLAAMDGIGLSGGNDHTENEYAELFRLPDLIKRAALFLYRVHAGSEEIKK